MKYRKDFVTNSSSSSFIIGKKEDTSVTQDFVYGVLRDLYIEFFKKRDEFMKHMDKYKVVYKEGDRWGQFEMADGRYNEGVDKSLQRDFGVMLWELYPLDTEWLKCKTYAEYEKYWEDRIKREDSAHAPFSIKDYTSKKKTPALEQGKWALQPEVREHDADGLLGWYLPCLFSKQSCDGCKWQGKQGDCQKVRDGSRENEDVVTLLGRVCVHSECGYMPEFVVENLSEMANFSCNHMG